MRVDTTVTVTTLGALGTVVATDAGGVVTTTDAAEGDAEARKEENAPVSSMTAAEGDVAAV